MTQLINKKEFSGLLLLEDNNFYPKSIYIDSPHLIFNALLRLSKRLYKSKTSIDYISLYSEYSNDDFFKFNISIILEQEKFDFFKVFQPSSMIIVICKEGSPLQTEGIAFFDKKFCDFFSNSYSSCMKKEAKSLSFFKGLVENKISKSNLRLPSIKAEIIRKNLYKFKSFFSEKTVFFSIPNDFIGFYNVKDYNQRLDKTTINEVLNSIRLCCYVILFQIKKEGKVFFLNEEIYKEKVVKDKKHSQNHFEFSYDLGKNKENHMENQENHLFLMAKVYYMINESTESNKNNGLFGRSSLWIYRSTVKYLTIVNDLKFMINQRGEVFLIDSNDEEISKIEVKNRFSSFFHVIFIDFIRESLFEKEFLMKSICIDSLELCFFTIKLLVDKDNIRDVKYIVEFIDKYIYL